MGKNRIIAIFTVFLCFVLFFDTFMRFVVFGPILHISSEFDQIQTGLSEQAYFSED